MILTPQQRTSVKGWTSSLDESLKYSYTITLIVGEPPIGV